MKTCLLLAMALLSISVVLAQSSQPLLSVSRFEGNNGDQVTTAIYSGFANSKRVKMTDPEVIARIPQGPDPTIIKTPAYSVTGRVNAVNFTNHSTTSSDGKSTYYFDCQISVELKLTNAVTSETEPRMFNSSSSSTTDHNSALLSAIRGLSGKADNYAREKFPAVLSILKILKESERKGIIEFRAEGEGLTKTGAERPIFGVPMSSKTHISIKHRYEFTRPDGTTRWVSEEIGEAKIIEIEGNDQADGQTAKCTVTKGGEKLQELWNKKATLVLITTN